MKVKLDKQAFQGFFVHHGEKLVLGVLVLAFLWMGYSAATRATYSRQPQELIQAADLAKQHIKETKPKPNDPPVNLYDTVAKRSRDAISEKDYAWGRKIDPNPFPEPALRSEPPLFPPEKLAASADVGSFLMKAGPSGQQQMGQRWVVLTGLVPADKQVQAYKETFKDLKRPDFDTPQYVYFSVERAELFGDTRDAKPGWVGINVNQARQILQTSWASSAQEVVAAPYLQDALVFPLGPLMNGSWDERVAHPPEISLVSAAAAPSAVGPKSKPGGAEGPLDRPPELRGKTAEDAPPGPPGAPAAAPGAAGPGMAPAAPAAAGMAPGGAGMMPGEVGREEHHAADVTAVPYLLLRFFDFTVQPGKQYKYRVMLWLANPNYNYDIHFLSDPKLAKEQWIKTEWSELNDPVSVPRDDRLLVKSVKPAVRITAEPTASVVLVKWLLDHGTEASKEFNKIERGQLANLSSDSALVAEGEEPPETPPAPGLVEEAKGAKKAGGPMITFRSENLILDMRGGEKWPWRGQLGEPGELLVLDFDGSLAVRTELDDLSALPKPKEKAAENLGTEPTDKKGTKKGKAEPAGSSALFGADDEGGKKPKKSGKKK